MIKNAGDVKRFFQITSREIEAMPVAELCLSLKDCVASYELMAVARDPRCEAVVAPASMMFAAVISGRSSQDAWAVIDSLPFTQLRNSTQAELKEAPQQLRRETSLTRAFISAVYENEAVPARSNGRVTLGTVLEYLR